MVVTLVCRAGGTGGSAVAGAPLRSPPSFAKIEKDNRKRKRHFISSIVPPQKYIFSDFPPFLAKGGFFSESAICFLDLQISKKKYSKKLS